VFQVAFLAVCTRIESHQKKAHYTPRKWKRGKLAQHGRLDYRDLLPKKTQPIRISEAFLDERSPKDGRSGEARVRIVMGFRHHCPHLAPYT
jgi:hypothetical protein